MWTSSLVSGDSSNVPSDVAFYRRASWLEEYASRKLRSIENRSEAKRKRKAETRRSGIGGFLIACLPCAGPKNRLGADQKSVAYSSQTSLTSMLEVRATQTVYDGSADCRKQRKNGCHASITRKHEHWAKSPNGRPNEC